MPKMVANMEMELVEASLFNWPLAPYDNKRDVDANMLEGMASHVRRAIEEMAGKMPASRPFSYCRPAIFSITVQLVPMTTQEAA